MNRGLFWTRHGNGHRTGGPLVLTVAAATLCALMAAGPPTARGFTQYTRALLPMGHEWITRVAGLEVLGGDRLLGANDPDDPRKRPDWKARATNTDVSGAAAEVQRIKTPKNDGVYASTWLPVWSAIMGQRWVDIAGFDVTKEMLRGKISVDCWDNVDQQPGSIQYDHFLRRDDDVGGEGGVRAATRARERFVRYFVAAAIAPTGTLTFYDGGASSDKQTADRNYFLFGRAVHLFEDSFSPEHTVRQRDDGFKRVRQVKSYICTAGSEQHVHEKPLNHKYGRHGDIIWTATSGVEAIGVATLTLGNSDAVWATYRASNMTEPALAATEATKDLWAAFVRAMARPPAEREAAARAEARRVADTWLGMDDAEARNWYSDAAHRGATYVAAPGENDGGAGVSIDQCVRSNNLPGGGTQASLVNQIFENQRQCLFNIKSVGDGERDPYLHMPYDWNWTNPITRYLDDAKSWMVPDETQTEEGGAPVDMAVAGGRLYLTYVNEAGAIYITSRTQDSGWIAPARVSHWVSGGAPAITAVGDALVLVHRGTDNRVYAGAARPGADGSLVWGNAVAADAKISTHHRPTLDTLGPALAEMVYRGDDWRIHFLQLKVGGVGSAPPTVTWTTGATLKAVGMTTEKVFYFFDRNTVPVEHRTVATPDVTTLGGRKYLASVSRQYGFGWAELSDHGLKNPKMARTTNGNEEFSWVTTSPASMVGVASKNAFYLAHRGLDDRIYWGTIAPNQTHVDNHQTEWRTYDGPVLAQFDKRLHLVYRAVDGRLFDAEMDPAVGTWSTPVPLPDAK